MREKAPKTAREVAGVILVLVVPALACGVAYWAMTALYQALGG